QINFLKKVWPGRVTIILKNKLGEKISFRIPAHKKLRKFIKQVGPIISTSANISGEKNVLKPDDLKQFIQDKIDFYIDEGELKGEASNILEFLR
ncbi:MAG: Sua5/YciO/YrdC/YwlC family protein, partial [Candidatus Pacebacteria bacterium]|nr:Sua5/YciO/YrdC/YwlC family protein [Candidatus Paceibacterota bacterium]